VLAKAIAPIRMLVVVKESGSKPAHTKARSPVGDSRRLDLILNSVMAFLAYLPTVPRSVSRPGLGVYRYVLKRNGYNVLGISHDCYLLRISILQYTDAWWLLGWYHSLRLTNARCKPTVVVPVY
jgi:hypothetical protein